MFGTQIDHPMTVTTPVRADPAATRTNINVPSFEWFSTVIGTVFDVFSFSQRYWTEFCSFGTQSGHSMTVTNCPEGRFSDKLSHRIQNSYTLDRSDVSSRLLCLCWYLYSTCTCTCISTQCPSAYESFVNQCL